MLPPAPGLLSITMSHLAALAIDCAIERDSTSVPPAGGKGTTSLIGLLGYASCASTAAGRKAASATAQAVRISARVIIGLLLNSSLPAPASSRRARPRY